VAHDGELVTLYHVIEREMGQSAADLTTVLNGIGANGWWLIENFVIRLGYRRTIFKDGPVTEYLVNDTITGSPVSDVENMLNSIGANGWEMVALDMVLKTTRRAIFARPVSGGSGGGGGIPEAPSDGTTYGRMNTTWNPALAHDSDVLDGGSF
jgi:hypothetical protein